MTPETPIPHDVPLPLPAPEWVLVAVLVVFFLMHIIFITMMVGGTMMTPCVSGERPEGPQVGCAGP